MFAATCALLVASCSCTDRNVPKYQAPAALALLSVEAVDGERAIERVRELVAISPRDSGTPGAARAALYLAKELKTLGIEVEIDEFIDAVPGGSNIFRNVTGTVKGSRDGLIVVGSHYDTKSGIEDFKGANDSGSSSGLLLELASVVSKGPRPGPDIMFAFFDGEECVKKYGRSDGFHGSKRLARKLVESGRKQHVLAVIVLDMIGDKDLNVSLPANNTAKLSAVIFKAATDEGARGKFTLARSFILDDHIPFIAAGMPAADMIDFSYGSKPGDNDYWHTPEDTMDKLSAESLETMGRITIRVINALSQR